MPTSENPGGKAARAGQPSPGSNRIPGLVTDKIISVKVDKGGVKRCRGNSSAAYLYQTQNKFLRIRKTINGQSVKGGTSKTKGFGAGCTNF